MSVNLSKGQKVSLAKMASDVGVNWSANTTNKLVVGLGWDVARSSGLRGLFSGTNTIDLDASALLLTDDRLSNKGDIVYFGNLTHQSGAVRHTGDNLTGEGEGDDEQIIVSLDKLPNQYNKIVFVVNIYQCVKKKQDFGMIENAFIRVVDYNSGVELCKFNLSDNYAGFTSMICAEVYRHNGEWKFNPVGMGTHDVSVSEIARSYK